MKDREIIDLLLLKETEICNKIHHAITEIMRLGYETERGRSQIPETIESINYLLEDLERILNR